MISYKVDLQGKTREFPHYWEQCIGSCHAATVLRADVQAQIRRAHEECGFQYLRFHGLFDDDMSVAFNSMGMGPVQYSFVNIDAIFDFLLSIGMRPFVEVGFMPSVLASGTQTCMHYRGNVTMPESDEAWESLIRKFAEHLLHRYGEEEVAQWFFEVWNEPNLNFFFDGTQEDYFHLYEITARTLKSVSGRLRVGGPATSVNAWIPEFRAYCENRGVPLDFITTHHYPSDDPFSQMGMNGPGVKGQNPAADPELRARFEAMSEEEKQAMIAQMFSRENKNPRDILAQMTRKAKAEAGDYPLYYTEWNGSKEYDTSYQAAFIAQTIAYNEKLVEGYSFWTVSDFFEEMGMKAGPFKNEFGIQTIYGVRKPSYRIFEALHQAGAKRLDVERVAASGSGVAADGTETEVCGTTDSCSAEAKEGGAEQDGYRTAEVMALTDGKQTTLFVYNHDLERRQIQTQEVEITLCGPVRRIEVAQINETHCNPLRAWKQMGEPEYPNAAQIKAMNEASQMVYEEMPVEAGEEQTIRLTMEPESVAVIRIC
ncbi:MAG: beta-xylosidase [Eubacteriales bacterium]|nr:beta-xylosidase [Eubacteriales bacterium]